MGIKYLLVIILATLAANVNGRAVSYPGGYTIMTRSDNFQNAIYLHYSPSYKYAIGVEDKKDKLVDEHYALLRFTYLINQKTLIILKAIYIFNPGILWILVIIICLEFMATGKRDVILLDLT